jgi:nucleotide-binding universal stress UspA family protein
MYKKILVPLDGSELAGVALPYAEELAGRLGSSVTLLFVSESAKFEDEYLHMHQFYIQKMAENIKKDIERKWGKQLAKEIKVNSEILVGNPADKIIDYADEKNIGLIVMSTHGRTGIGRWAIGSVAYKVVKAVSTPVYLVRAKGTDSDMRQKDKLDKVLVPLDGSKKSEAVIPYVEELASKLKIKVTFLQAMVPDYGITSEDQLRRLQTSRASTQDYIENMAARFRQKGIVSRAEFRELLLDPTGVAAEINKLADGIQADLVVMSTRGRSEFDLRPGEEEIERLGSVVEKVVHSGNAPLMLVKPE